MFAIIARKCGEVDILTFFRKTKYLFGPRASFLDSDLRDVFLHVEGRQAVSLHCRLAAASTVAI